MSNENRVREIVDAAEVALATTGAIVGGQMGAALGVLGVLANKMCSPLQQFRRARESRFLERVSHYLEANDPEGAASFVAEHAADEQFSDVLGRGYEKMRRAFDPLAEECICVLVADHLRSGSVTDRRFVRTGSLLEISDKEMLTTIDGICGSYVAATRQRGPGVRAVVFCSNGVPNTTGPFLFVAAYEHSEVIGISDNIPAAKNTEQATVQLESHGFGQVPRGLGHAPPEERREGGPSSLLTLGPSDHEAMLSLHRYLSPVRRAPG